MIECLPDEKAFGHAAKYHVHPKHLEEVCWSLNKKIQTERQTDKFLIYPVPESIVGDKVLVRNHTKYVWDLKYDVAYRVV